MSHETDGLDSPSNLQAEEEALSKVENFPAPIGELLGLKLIQPEKGLAVVEFEADERYANPAGIPHGGGLCDIADAAMGFAYRSTLADDESLTTIELKIISCGRCGERSFTRTLAWFAPAGSSGSSSAMSSTKRSDLWRARWLQFPTLSALSTQLRFSARVSQPTT